MLSSRDRDLRQNRGWPSPENLCFLWLQAAMLQCNQSTARNANPASFGAHDSGTRN
jgi:hypothetical protein